MRFYDCTTAPSPRRARIFMAEKGIEIPTVQVDLRNGEQFSETFRAVNPTCTVPVIELDDGRRIWETVAVCRYLEETYPDPPLMGVDPADKAIVAMWDHRMEFEGFQAAADALRNASPRLAGHALPGAVEIEQIPALAERGRRRVGVFFDTLEARLAESPFVAGERFTVADITAFVTVDFAGWIKLAPPESHASLRRWYDTVAARPSAKA